MLGILPVVTNLNCHLLQGLEPRLYFTTFFYFLLASVYQALTSKVNHSSTIGEGCSFSSTSPSCGVASKCDAKSTSQ